MFFFISRLLAKHKYQNSTVPTNLIHHSLTPAEPLHETSQEAPRLNLDGIGKHGHVQEGSHTAEEATTEEGTDERREQES